MAVTFTADQQRVIDTRNKNILVSAAAGSGKTAVLVERIIQRIMDPDNPIDIDRMLVVTFTNAAAAGMKERISNAIQAKLFKEPDNAHLQRQAVLVHQAQITTIHSFCLYLIRNHFEAISLEPDFTVADEATIQLLSAEVKAELLEEAFEKGEDSFIYMVEFICHNGRERILEEYMNQLYNRAMSMPFPKSWLLERKKDYDFDGLDAFTNTEAGRYLLQHMKALIHSYADAYQRLYQVCVEPDGPYMHADLIEKEWEYLKKLAAEDSLEEISKRLPNMPFGRLSTKKDESVHAGKRKRVADKRASYKKAIQELSEQFFGKSPQTMEIENKACSKVLGALVDLTLEYMERLTLAKRKKGIIDFHDMEHMALEILLRETADGYEPTEIAKTYQQYFEEVMVDEYQDSNMVQEYLVTAVSGEELGKYNRFMVGDVKQSIYKFRLARPEIFMEKYHKYAQKQHDTGVIASNDNCVRIDLKKNFRSRPEVLHATNSVFEKVMLSELGGIAYDENAALYQGSSFETSSDMETECIVVTEEHPEQFDHKQWEAYCVAKRIKKLLREGKVLDQDGLHFRKVTLGDIVILFRSPSTFENSYRKIFEEEQIPLYITSGNGYFDTVEIQHIMKFLQAIENPRMDIAMYGACISIFGGMTENQLATVKVHYGQYVEEKKLSIQKSEQCLYDMLQLYSEHFPEEEITKKIYNLQEKLQKYRRKAEYLTAAELIYEILRDYEYREYVSVLPDGQKRLANVELLLEKAKSFGVGKNQSLFAFTLYMNQLQKQAVDFGEASTADQTNAVRVMSIHKSKGLEFPIVFVCGMGQNYQMRDKQQMILMDHDMGIGMDYINPTLRSKNKTLRKNVIARKMEMEILAEEQRILYVAMTRAKEKLILVGFHAKAEDILEWEDAMTNEKGTAMFSDVLDATSYLDLCLLARDRNTPISYQVMGTEDYVFTEVTETISLSAKKEYLLGELNRERTSTERQKKYGERFDFTYPYMELKNLYSKTSVSELKLAALKQDQEAVFDTFEKQNELEIIPYIPDFMKEQGELTGAERGIAYHRVLELLDFANPPKNASEWKEVLSSMVNSGKLTQQQRNCIYIRSMEAFIQSSIGTRIVQAAEKGTLHKEQSFFLGVPAREVDQEFPEEEMMLVQGIIDAYFEEDGNVILVDYKTDAVKHVQELEDRYRVQMMYYKKALEQALEKNVGEIVLYSLSLGKEVVIE